MFTGKAESNHQPGATRAPEAAPADRLPPRFQSIWSELRFHDDSVFTVIAPIPISVFAVAVSTPLLFHFSRYVGAFRRGTFVVVFLVVWLPVNLPDIVFIVTIARRHLVTIVAVVASVWIFYLVVIFLLGSVLDRHVDAAACDGGQGEPDDRKKSCKPKFSQFGEHSVSPFVGSS